MPFKIQPGAIPTGKPDMVKSVPGGYGSLNWDCQCGEHALTPPLHPQSEASAQLCTTYRDGHVYAQLLHVLTRLDNGELLLRVWRIE